MNHSEQIDIQLCQHRGYVPDRSLLIDWIGVVLQNLKQPDAELCIRVVDSAEIQQLNQRYRGRNSPTNVLSFPVELPESIQQPYIGDVVICANVVAEQANEQNKSLQQHWAHMVVHGVLHLFGYDHINDGDAQRMENLEVELLHKLGLPNPYDCQATANEKLRV